MTLTRALPWHAAEPRTEPPATHRALVALWTLFHAQALLNGNPGDPQDPAFLEADHSRLGRQRRHPQASQ
jgi:hypothetical protein